MINTNNNLFTKLESLVSDVHLSDVKKIINALSRINDFKHTIENELCHNTVYENIALELKNEFNILDFKIDQFENNINTLLYQHGNSSNCNYTIRTKVATDTDISVILNGNNLKEFDILCLNSYFKELSHLLYIQFVLKNLQDNSLVDQLTQLKNRISFQEEMKALIPLALREKMNIGVLLINIDRFRAVNDEHGNEFGDNFLKLYANTITHSIRNSDIAIRFGGGEFLVLLLNVDNEIRTIDIANKIRDKLSQTYLLTKDNDHFKKTVCIGVSMFPDDSVDINEVVKNAEIALDNARESGRNRVLKYELNQHDTIEFF